MAQEKKAKANPLYSLIPLEDFKAVLGVDDREDKITRFCLVTSTLTIEQHCKRRFLRKTQFEYIDFYGDLILRLKNIRYLRYQLYMLFSQFLLLNLLSRNFIRLSLIAAVMKIYLFRCRFPLL